MKDTETTLSCKDIWDQDLRCFQAGITGSKSMRGTFENSPVIALEMQHFETRDPRNRGLEEMCSESFVQKLAEDVETLREILRHSHGQPLSTGQKREAPSKHI